MGDGYSVIFRMTDVDILEPHRPALVVDQVPDPAGACHLVLPAFVPGSADLPAGQAAAERMIPVGAPPWIGGEGNHGRVRRLPGGVGTAPPIR